MKVIQRWNEELTVLSDKQELIFLHRRIEKYLDQGYGSAYLKDPRVAKIVQDSLLKFDGVRYNLFSWVVMPNHSSDSLEPQAVRALRAGSTSQVGAFIFSLPPSIF